MEKISRQTIKFQGKNKHRCTFCNFTCAFKSILESHMIVHTRERPFFCHECDRRFGSKQHLNKHTRYVHQGLPIERNKKYKCSLCPYKTYNKSHFENHTTVHTGERSFPCQYQNCGYAAKTSVALQNHTTRKHKNERKFLCQVPNCGYRAITRADMIKHSVKHSGCRPFVCSFVGCSYRSKTKGALKQHQDGVHNENKPFACQRCDFCTNYKSALRMHELIHTDEKSVKCNFSDCAFSCKSKRNFRLHVLNLHTERAVKCDLEGCLFAAASRCKLGEHKKLVHSEKVHKCPHCDFRAANPSSLQLHTDRHSSSQRIPCPKNGCTFQAKHRNSLCHHMRYHKENLGCFQDGCDYLGTSKQALNHHMQLHDPAGRPFHCPLCPKHFSTNGVLSVHLKSHTKEKPAKCPACSFSAANKWAIKQHVRTNHPTLRFNFDKRFTCNHCYVKFDSAVSLAIHKVNLKTAVVLLTRVHIKIDG